MSQTIEHPPEHRSTEAEPAMAFQWLRCPKHEYLGVSILIGRGFEPMCFLETGASHNVDAVELRRAAA